VEVCFRAVRNHVGSGVNVIGEESGNSAAVGSSISAFQIYNAQFIGATFQFSFASQAGVVCVVESSTPLPVSVWQPRTNVTGDGTLKTIQLPMNPGAAEFFRLRTQWTTRRGQSRVLTTFFPVVMKTLFSSHGVKPFMQGTERWRRVAHDDFALVPPRHQIPKAEALDLIGTLPEKSSLHLSVRFLGRILQQLSEQPR
jgi:hypothetical protein